MTVACVIGHKFESETQLMSSYVRTSSFCVAYSWGPLVAEREGAQIIRDSQYLKFTERVGSVDARFLPRVGITEHLPCDVGTLNSQSDALEVDVDTRTRVAVVTKKIPVTKRCRQIPACIECLEPTNSSKSTMMGEHHV